VGDPVYGHKRNWWKKRGPLTNRILPLVKRQQLHAETLGFVHPESEKYCEFKAPLADDMAHVLRVLRRSKVASKKDKKA
jgi:23S rRNA pseudouridine1911/1915/1917 synthase